MPSHLLPEVETPCRLVPYLGHLRIIESLELRRNVDLH